MPFREKHLFCITPVTVVPDEAILSSGERKLTQADFLTKEAKITLKVN